MRTKQTTNKKINTYNMKNFQFILIIAILLTKQIQAQTKVCYNYDKAGNRINNICLKSTLAQADSAAIAQPITENLGEMTITLYPNPTKGQLTIKVANMPEDVKGEIILSDITGRLLMKQKAIRETTLIDISSHPTGIYVLKIRIGDKVSEWKVIKE
jgi:hypothetical protein